MPELPEVETVRAGLGPAITGATIVQSKVYNANLRWPVAPNFEDKVEGRTVMALKRRAKYLVFTLDRGAFLVHLGMSGVICRVTEERIRQPHDHYEILFSNGVRLRYNDPRRFGSLIWIDGDPLRHRLLRDLGPEPLTGALNAKYLYRISRGRKVAVKLFMMNQRVVVGVGNIYASEALFDAGINPKRQAGRLSQGSYGRITAAVKLTLENAIASGGTTLNDFRDSNGKPGYFEQELKVYGRENRLCVNCATPIRKITQAGRASYYCPNCQH